MPLTIVPLPFGIRDVKVAVLGANDAPGTLVDFPGARTLSFSEAESFEELRGDDGVLAVHGSGPTVDWELEGGGFSFDAVKALYGGTVTDSGTTPNQKREYVKLDTDQRPYVKIEGQAISDSGGDFHVTLWKARATGELSGTLADQAYWLTGASGRAIAKTADRKLYTITQNETAAAIV
jgi:hypothetical protein